MDAEFEVGREVERAGAGEGKGEGEGEGSQGRAAEWEGTVGKWGSQILAGTGRARKVSGEHRTRPFWSTWRGWPVWCHIGRQEQRTHGDGSRLQTRLLTPPLPPPTRAAILSSSWGGRGPGELSGAAIGSSGCREVCWVQRRMRRASSRYLRGARVGGRVRV